MVTAGRLTCTTVGTPVFSVTNELDSATAFYVCTESGSANGALISVDGLHESDEFLPLGVGKEIIFRHGNFGIKQVTIKGDGGDTDVAFGIVSRTYPSD